MPLPIPRFARQTFLSLITVSLAVLPIAGTQAANSAPPTKLPPFVRTTIADLKSALNLTPPQQVQFAKAVAKTEQVVPQIRANHEALLAAIRGELEKEIPDLAALAVEKDNSELANMALRQSARAEWLNLYAMLTPEQVATLKVMLNQILSKLEAIGQVFSGLNIGLP